MANSDDDLAGGGPPADLLRDGEAAIAHLSARTRGRGRRAVATAALAGAATIAGAVTAAPAHAKGNTIGSAPILNVTARVGTNPILHVTIATDGPLSGLSKIGPVVPKVASDIVQVDIVAIPHPGPACMLLTR